jgi:hypothetical protein
MVHPGIHTINTRIDIHILNRSLHMSWMKHSQLE